MLLLVLGLSAVLASSASAAEVHVFSKSFGAGELALGSNSGVALDQETGEVYVSDTGNSRVAKFTAAGVADGTLATVTEPTFVAVDNSTGASKGDIYVVSSSGSTITKLSPAGVPVAGWGTAGKLEGLGEIAGITVDEEGDLWVFNLEAVMREFDPAGAELTEFTALNGEGNPIGVSAAGIAIDSSDNLYMVRGSRAVTEYSSTGQNLTPSISELDTEALTFDPGENSLFIGRENQVAIYSLSQQPVEEHPTATEIFARGEEAGGVNGVGGLAVRATTGAAYVANVGSDEVALFAIEDVEPPTVSIEPPSSIEPTTAHVSGEVDPEGYTTTCKFQYVTAAHFADQGFAGPEARSCLTEPGSGSGPVPVEGELEELVPGTTYYVRLVATNPGGTGVSAEPYPTFTAAVAAPTVSNEFASGVTYTEATLNGTIVPGGGATQYSFDYLPEAAFLLEGFSSSQTRTTAQVAVTPVDDAGHQVSATVRELAPATPYVFRLLATNSAETAYGTGSGFRTQTSALMPETGCPNQSLRTGPGASLPDCRAYEQVSPVDKNGGSVQGFPGLLLAAEDGSAATFYSQAVSTIGSSGGTSDLSTILAAREGETWTSQRLLPPQEFGEHSSFLGSTPDLKYAVVEAQNEGQGNGLFVVDTGDHSVTQIVPYADNDVITGNGGYPHYAFDGASSDGSRFFFETKAQLTTQAAAEEDNLYMWDRASGAISLVGVLPGETRAPSGGSFGGAYAWYGEPSTERGGALQGLAVGAPHAISPGGEQVFFTAGVTGQLYLRRGLTTEDPSTVRISTPNPSVEDPYVEEERLEGQIPAAFQEATPDGSSAFFLSSQKLTNDATTGPEDQGKDLYRWDAASGRLVDITPDTDPEAMDGAEVQGLLGVSEDGSSGYFAARGILASGAVAGAENLYRFDQGPTGFVITFLAALRRPVTATAENFPDIRNWSPQTYSGGGEIADEETVEAKNSRVSADGETLLFTSVESLTGFGNRSPGCVHSENSRCAELYRYSQTTGRVTCISCDPTGQAPLGEAALQSPFINAYLSPQGIPSVALPRNLSSDGNRIFFQSPDPLVASDTNGATSCRHYNEELQQGPDCLDVYEWDAPGEGSCREVEADGGCLYLLSSGQSDRPSYFLGASSDGSSAFIITASQLVPSDADQLFDAYDARIDGGLASQHLEPGPACVGEACQSPAAGEPAAAAPGSTSLVGPGNPRHKKKHHKKKHHKKKHHKTERGKSSSKRGPAGTDQGGKR